MVKVLQADVTVNVAVLEIANRLNALIKLGHANKARKSENKLK